MSQETHQPSPRFESWKEHPYGKQILDDLGAADFPLALQGLIEQVVADFQRGDRNMSTEQYGALREALGVTKENLKHIKRKIIALAEWDKTSYPYASTTKKRLGRDSVGTNTTF